MHVLQLGPYPPPWGGVSRNMLAIRDQLVAGGHTCTIVATAQSSGEHEAENVYRPRSARELIRLLRSLDYDILHMHIGGDVTSRLVGLGSACTMFGGPHTMLTLHSGGLGKNEKDGGAKLSAVAGLMFRRFGRVIAVNDSLGDVLRDRGVSAERIRVIAPYALSLPDKDVEMPPELRAFYERWDPVLLAVGGLERDYEPLFQIAAMREVLRHLPNAGLMIVGDGSLRQEVGSAAAASGYAEHICLAGDVDHQVTLNLIDDADILLRTTLFDGDAISVREALFLGTPVIATDNGMRPAGPHLIKTGDTAGFVAKVVELASAGGAGVASTTPDTGNIEQVIRLYEEMLLRRALK